MYSLSTKVENPTDIRLRRIVRLKLSSATQKGADWFLSMRPSAIVCLEFCVSVYHGKFYHSEMTDITLRYGSADGVALRAQALYREKFPTRRVPHSQKFLAAVQRLRESGTFRMRSADRGQERTPRVLDLEPQILEIWKKTRQHVPGSWLVNFMFLSLWYVALLKSKSYGSVTIMLMLYSMIKKSLDQSSRGINKLSRKLFISMIFNIYLTTFKFAGYNLKCFKENIQFLVLSHTTVMEIVVKMVIGFIRLVYV
jgi:hypothetical protein